MSTTLNERAKVLIDTALPRSDVLRINASSTSNGAQVIDCGVNAQGGLQAGLLLARACTADLADFRITTGTVDHQVCPYVEVTSDQPLLACMASQYAGWKISVDKFFAMGSGPMRAMWGKEEIFNDVPGKETPPVAVGVLESEALPNEAVIDYFVGELSLPADKITLLVAPTASLAGTFQVVARSLETALHKLHELGFDLSKVISGAGSAPLPPIAKDFLGALGRTNDAILYGGRVTLWVDAEDDELADVVPSLPSSASADYGELFGVLFKSAGYDFYVIDPMLFSPAEVMVHNVRTGRSHHAGKVAMDVLQRSFFQA